MSGEREEETAGRPSYLAGTQSPRNTRRTLVGVLPLKPLQHDERGC